MNRLPWDAKSYVKPTNWQIRAAQAARQAIRQLDRGAALAEVEAEARQAVEKIASEFEAHKAARADAEMRETVVRWASLPDGLSSEGKEMAKQADVEALAKLPPGTPCQKLERVRDEILAPLRAEVAELQQEQAQRERERQEQERKKQEGDLKLFNAQLRVAWCLPHVDGYLRRLEDRQEIEFDSFSDRWDTTEKFKAKIRPILVQELACTPDMPDDKITKRIEKLVDEHLDAVLEA